MQLGTCWRKGIMEGSAQVSPGSIVAEILSSSLSVCLSLLEDQQLYGINATLCAMTPSL